MVPQNVMLFGYKVYRGAQVKVEVISAAVPDQYDCCPYTEENLDTDRIAHV